MSGERYRMLRVPDADDPAEFSIAKLLEHALFLAAAHLALDGATEKPPRAARNDALEAMLAAAVIAMQRDWERQIEAGVRMDPRWSPDSLDRLIAHGWRCEYCGSSGVNAGGVTSRSGGPVVCEPCATKEEVPHARN